MDSGSPSGMTPTLGKSISGPVRMLTSAVEKPGEAWAATALIAKAAKAAATSLGTLILCVAPDSGDPLSAMRGTTLAG